MNIVSELFQTQRSNSKKKGKIKFFFFKTISQIKSNYLNSFVGIE